MDTSVSLKKIISASKAWSRDESHLDSSKCWISILKLGRIGLVAFMELDFGQFGRHDFSAEGGESAGFGQKNKLNQAMFEYDFWTQWKHSYWGWVFYLVILS